MCEEVPNLLKVNSFTSIFQVELLFCPPFWLIFSRLILHLVFFVLQPHRQCPYFWSYSEFISFSNNCTFEPLCFVVRWGSGKKYINISILNFFQNVDTYYISLLPSYRQCYPFPLSQYIQLPFSFDDSNSLNVEVIVFNFL